MTDAISRAETKRKMEELLSEYEMLKAEARNAQSDRKEEIEENIKDLSKAEKDLREKYEKLENFGSITMEEISKAFFTSADAFSDSIKNIKKRL